MKSRVAFHLTAAAFLLSAMNLIGCKDNGTDPYQSPAPVPPPPSGGGSVSFQASVLPLLQGHGCTGCHGGTKSLFVGSVAQLLTGGADGPAIVPSNAAGSLLVKKISAAPPFGARMPLGGPYLSSTEIQTISDWINQGAKDN